MAIYNVCSECGCAISIRKKAQEYLNKMLSETNDAVCHLCDPKSSWLNEKNPLGHIFF